MNLNFVSFPQTTFNVVYSSVNLPQLRSPYLICGFPGTGYVGKIAIDHLIQELNAKHLADIYSTSFPAQIMIRTEGIAELMKNTIFYSKAAVSSGNDVLLLTGDSQPISPESEYLLAECAVRLEVGISSNRLFGYLFILTHNDLIFQLINLFQSLQYLNQSFSLCIV